ncbi:MAG: cupredoxin domain-containing protein [Candidatus Doudnabacteria bacterium]|nr:cupredoxin domain-containing protein [Candidatus Doudnabacteria bacterium]
MKKILYFLLVIFIIAGGYYAYSSNFKKISAPHEPFSDQGIKVDESGDILAESPRATSVDMSVKTEEKAAIKPADQELGTFSTGDEAASGSDIQVIEVVYDGNNFSPINIDIKINDYVFFRNNSSQDFWPASANHPDHTVYSEFDAKKPVAPGKVFKFQFTKAGSWDFHDHLNPEAMGVVSVK